MCTHRQPLTHIAKSMFFWSHHFLEASESHSHYNEGEAEMVVAFTMSCKKEG